MKINKSRRNNIILLVVLLLLIIPQTRQPLQVVLHKAVALVNSPKIVDAEERESLINYDWNLKNLTTDANFNFNEAKGKVVVINFWATWCPPCIAEMPSLQKLYDAYSSEEEVVFLFVTNDDKALIEKFKTKRGYTFDVYNPISDYRHLFDIKSIPRTFIIDKQGRLVVDKKGAVDWFGDDIKDTMSDLLGE
ncbi:MAG: TlpA disulfide reductase family protein [Bacteroidota bacterium]